MQDNELRHTLSDRFNEYGSQPSDGVWTAIEAELDKDQRKRGFLWWWIGFTTAAVFGIAGIYISMQTNNPPANVTTELQVVQHEDKTPEKNTSDEQASQEILMNTSSHQTGNRGHVNRISGNNSYKNLIPDPTEFEPLVHLSESTSFEVPPTLTTIENPTESKEINTSLPTRKNERFIPLNTITNCQFKPRKIRPSYWELGIEMSSFANASRKNLKVTNDSTPNPTSYDSYSLTPGLSPEFQSASITHQRFAEIRLTARRSFGKRFQIATGVSGTYAQTKGTSETYLFSFRTQHWGIGIPVQIRYKILQQNRWNLTPYIGIQNEFQFLTYYSCKNNPPATQSILEDLNGTSTIKGRGTGYLFGIEPGIELSYYLTDRVSLSTSVGYRNYFVRSSKNVPPGSYMTPNYLQFSIGTAWLLR